MTVWLKLTAIVVVLSVALPPLLNNSGIWNWRAWSFFSTKEIADLLLTNGTIYTSDVSLPFVDSMAVRNGRVLRVGSYSSIKDFAGYETQKLNLEGKILLPGFIDSHVHLIFGGLQMARVELRGVYQKDKFIAKVKEAVTNIKHGSWVLGGGWNNDLWGGEFPMASWIDDITPNNPVWLSRMDGHMGFANSLALKMAQVNKYTADPNGGSIMRSSNGEPTGLLIDSAMKLVLLCIPEVSVDERREALIRASNLALTRGVTTVVDFGRYFPGASVESSWQDFADVYSWADLSREMRIRVCLYFPMETWSRLVDLIHKTGQKLSQWIYLGGVKEFADGSLGSNSALLYEAYADEPNNYGLQVADFRNLLNMTILSDKSGLQVAIHAIGDKANDLILDMYESVIATNGMKDRRFRIEHVQHLASRSAARFGQQGIVASVQFTRVLFFIVQCWEPDHLIDDADSAIRKLGLDRAWRGSYLFRSLLSSKTQLAFGSDWPVADINPLHSIRTAMKRIPAGWEEAWIPSEHVSLDDALNAYTISAARACFLDNEVGSLAPGKLADFVVLSSDSWDDFADGGLISVESTYVGGVRAYDSVEKF